MCIHTCQNTSISMTSDYNLHSNFKFRSRVKTLVCETKKNAGKTNITQKVPSEVQELERGLSIMYINSVIWKDKFPRGSARNSIGRQFTSIIPDVSYDASSHNFASQIEDDSSAGVDISGQNILASSGVLSQTAKYTGEIESNVRKLLLQINIRIYFCAVFFSQKLHMNLLNG